MGISVCATTGCRRHAGETAHLALHSDGHVNLVQELHEMHLSLHANGHVDDHIRELQLSSQQLDDCNVGARMSSPRLHSETGPAQQGHRSPCQCTATEEFLWFPEQDHGNLSLHHDRDVNDLVQICDELQLRNLHSFLHCHYPSTCCCTTTGVSTVSKNCKTRRCMITGVSATLVNCTKKSTTTLSRYCTAELPQFSARRTRHAQ